MLYRCGADVISVGMSELLFIGFAQCYDEAVLLKTQLLASGSMDGILISKS